MNTEVDAGQLIRCGPMRAVALPNGSVRESERGGSLDGWLVFRAVGWNALHGLPLDDVRIQPLR